MSFYRRSLPKGPGIGSLGLRRGQNGTKACNLPVLWRQGSLAAEDIPNGRSALNPLAGRGISQPQSY
jgi:hypothetical protein